MAPAHEKAPSRAGDTTGTQSEDELGSAVGALRILFSLHILSRRTQSLTVS